MLSGSVEVSPLVMRADHTSISGISGRMELAFAGEGEKPRLIRYVYR